MLFALCVSGPTLCAVVVQTGTSQQVQELRALHVHALPPRLLPLQDFFLLNACRAAADMLVTSGSNVRLENNLETRVQGAFRSGLLAWRSTLPDCSQQEPRPVIVTQSVLPDGYPILEQTPPPVLLTPCAAEQVRALGHASSVDVCDVAEYLRPPGTAMEACQAALAMGRRHGLHNVLLEVGPAFRPVHIAQQLVFSVMPWDALLALWEAVGCEERVEGVVGECVATVPELELDFELLVDHDVSGRESLWGTSRPLADITWSTRVFRRKGS